MSGDTPNFQTVDEHDDEGIHTGYGFQQAQPPKPDNVGSGAPPAAGTPSRAKADRDANGKTGIERGRDLHRKMHPPRDKGNAPENWSPWPFTRGSRR